MAWAGYTLPVRASASEAAKALGIPAHLGGLPRTSGSRGEIQEVDQWHLLTRP